MVLIYSATHSPRLQYICNFIFCELMGADFIITTNQDEFINDVGTKINYSNLQIQQSTIHIQPYPLLFETGIKQQIVECFDTNDYKAFFKTINSQFPFDIFAASFYLISRYEEYLPHQKDMYGRYAHENSLAFKENFLHLPLINIWVNDFAKILIQKFPTFIVQKSSFKFIPTYDIDIAYSYKGKGRIRNFVGFLKKPSAERIKVLLGNTQDPFDNYNWLDSLHNKFNVTPIYFFLVAKKNGVYDKNILPHKKIVQHLIKSHAKKYTIGVHPSWQTGDHTSLLQNEIATLQTIIQPQKLDSLISRQHYIRFNLPQGYQQLIDAGVKDDYSMGYGSINGFRASVASPFYWYNIETEQQTNLKIHPFCYMEANSIYEQKYSSAQAFDEIISYYKICKEVNGTLITIFHNNMIGTHSHNKDWGKMYEHFLSCITK